MSMRTSKARRGATAASIVGLTLTMGALVGCSDASSDGDAAGVDSLPSSRAPETSSASPASTEADVLSSFSDSFDGDDNGWALPPSELGTTTVQGGDFVWDDKMFELRPHVIASTLADAFDQGRLEMTDVRVTASVTPKRGAPAVGVYCREVPDTDADFQWYEFVVRDGYAAIRLADLSGNLEPLAEAEEVALPVGTAATIEATCIDGADGTAVLSLSLDGDELLTAEASEALGNGGAGLQAYDAAEGQSDEPMLVAWHDFSVAPAT